MSMTAEEFNRLYMDDEAWYLAEGFYGEENNSWYPIICAGRAPASSIFFITPGSSGYGYDLYLVDEEIIEEHETIYAANDWYDFYNVNDLEEVVDMLRM